MKSPLSCKYVWTFTFHSIMYHCPMQYNNVSSSFSQRKRGSPGKVIPDGCKEPVEHSQVALAVFSSQMERFRF